MVYIYHQNYHAIKNHLLKCLSSTSYTPINCTYTEVNQCPSLLAHRSSLHSGLPTWDTRKHYKCKNCGKWTGIRWKPPKPWSGPRQSEVRSSNSRHRLPQGKGWKALSARQRPRGQVPKHLARKSRRDFEAEPRKVSTVVGCLCQEPKRPLRLTAARQTQHRRLVATNLRSGTKIHLEFVCVSSN